MDDVTPLLSALTLHVRRAPLSEVEEMLQILGVTLLRRLGAEEQACHASQLIARAARVVRAIDTERSQQPSPIFSANCGEGGA